MVAKMESQMASSSVVQWDMRRVAYLVDRWDHAMAAQSAAGLAAYSVYYSVDDLAYQMAGTWAISMAAMMAEK